MTAFGRLLQKRGGEEGAALLYEDRRWSYRERVEEGRRRALLFAELRDPARPPHVGVLLDSVPDYLCWLAAGALSGTVVVGINSTYRGDQLAQLIDHTDCQVLVTSADLAPLLDGLATAVPPERVLVVDEPEHRDRLAAAPSLAAAHTPLPDDDHLFLLIFTSGSTGLPGRSNDWLRVDGENFAAGPVEAILARHPDVRSVAVYAVPDDPADDRRALSHLRGAPVQ